MATVVSLTESKIRELLSEWDDITLTQEEINSLIIQIAQEQDSVTVRMDELNNEVLPQLQQDLAQGSILVSELNDTKLPQLQQSLEQARLELQGINEVDIPALQAGLDAQIVNYRERPKVYVQPEPPTNPDQEERNLVVGDSWFDSDDNNRQRVWNGVEWSTFGIDIPDFSVTVRKFMSTTHLIY